MCAHLFLGAGVECIIVLLRAGADSNVRNLDGKLALDSAIENGKDECVSALKLEGIHKEVSSKVDFVSCLWPHESAYIASDSPKISSLKFQS